MKRMFVVFGIAVMLFSGCEQFMSSDQLIRTPALQFSSLSEIRAYVRSNIHYKWDDTDYWQAPQETIDKGTGDCEDYCLFVGYFADKLGYDVHLVCIEKPDGNHMILKLNNMYYEAQTVSIYAYADKYPKIASWSLEDALKQCYLVYHSKSAL